MITNPVCTIINLTSVRQAIFNEDEFMNDFDPQKLATIPPWEYGKYYIVNWSVYVTNPRPDFLLPGNIQIADPRITRITPRYAPPIVPTTFINLTGMPQAVLAGSNILVVCEPEELEVIPVRKYGNYYIVPADKYHEHEVPRTDFVTEGYIKVRSDPSITRITSKFNLPTD